MATLDRNYTLSYAGHYQGDGGAISLTTPFQADCLMLFNYTAYGTARDNVEILWFRDFPAGDALIKTVIADDGSTSDQNLNLETTNGITKANVAQGVSELRTTITGATQANPVVVTAASHGMADGDHCRIVSVVGMTALNNKEFVVKNPTTNTFELYELDGVTPLDGTGFGAYSSAGTVIQIRGDGSDGYEWAETTYKLTLGSATQNDNDDEIYFIAWKFGSYVDLGDQA